MIIGMLMIILMMTMIVMIFESSFMIFLVQMMSLVSIEFPLSVCYANAHMAQLYTRSCSFTTAL